MEFIGIYNGMYKWNYSSNRLQHKLIKVSKVAQHWCLKWSKMFKLNKPKCMFHLIVQHIIFSFFNHLFYVATRTYLLVSLNPFLKKKKYKDLGNHIHMYIKTVHPFPASLTQTKLFIYLRVCFRPFLLFNNQFFLGLIPHWFIYYGYFPLNVQTFSTLSH